ncbi:MAG TPA: phosphatidate cytidylyltransferase [Caldisericia bacterium]|nr:phosphatidate cytidylyltransferase [Caldisericia bacterium]
MAQSELKNRIIGALYFGIPFLLFIYLGGLYFKIFLIILSILSIYELLKISNPNNYFLFIPLTILPFFIDKTLSIIVFILYSYLIFLIRKDDPKNFLSNICLYTIFLIISSIPLSYFYDIRVEKGFKYAILVIVSIWIIDISAYFVGKNFGKHKILPKISPNKSYEGLIGSLIIITIFLIIINSIFKFFPLSFTILFSISITILSFLSDTFESLIKRYFGVKDIGKIIIGHGGVFDRIDSFIFTIPILYYIL